MLKFISLTLVFMLVPPIFAQDLVKVKTRDGDLFKATALYKEIVLETQFGELKVPIDKIHKISFQIHHSKETASAIDTSIKNLTDADFKKRDVATKNLVELGQIVYRKIKSLVTTDPEILKRQQIIIKKIEENFLPEELQELSSDVIETTQGILYGKILNESFKFRHNDLGEFSLPPSRLKEISSVKETKTSLSLDAKDSPRWFKTNVSLNKYTKTTLKASGSVDLFPTEAGKYVASPNGYTNNGHTTLGLNSPFPAGSLVGKIGDKGRSFFVGGNFEFSDSEGELYLCIIPSAWQNESKGGFEITIRSR